MKKRIMILMILILSFLITGCMNQDKRIKWDELVLGDRLPELDNKKGYIYDNSDENLDFYISNITNKEYYDYLKKCIQKGFEIDSKKTDYNYQAYSKDGFKIELIFLESTKQMSIYLKCPKEYKTIEWSKSNIASKLPITKSLKGEIIEDLEGEYLVEIANTTREDLNEYINTCKENGFNQNEKKEEDIIFLENEEGYRLEIEYIGYNVICISIKEPLYEVTLKVNCVENKIFSKYDVAVWVDDEFIEILEHGKKDEYQLFLTKGKHEILFENEDDYDIDGKIKVDIQGSEIIEVEISCTNNGIDVKLLSNNTIVEEEESEEEYVVSYSTNGVDTINNGNTGKYAYKREGVYDNYIIIDFDDGYVYSFTERNNDDTCERAKITSGDLNTVVIVTYNMDESTYKWGYHFKYKNKPEQLIVEDDDHFETEYYATNIQYALNYKERKTIYEY